MVEYLNALSKISNDDLDRTFNDAYGSYLDRQDVLHDAERDNNCEDKLTGMLHETLTAKELVAQAAMGLYHDSSTAGDFSRRITGLIADHPEAISAAEKANYSDSVLHGYISPVSLRRDDIPSPVESILATAKNLGIVNVFAAQSSSAEGVLLSGTNAWGAFYAVKGGAPEQLLKQGTPQVPYNRFSDIDMLMYAPAVSDLGELVASHISAGLLDSRESKRFEAFEDMYEEGEADIFSVRAHFRDVEESIHYVLEDTLGQIRDQTPMRNRSVDGQPDIRYVRDYRPNIPGNVRKYGGYPLYDLKRMRDLVFSPTIRKISDITGEPLGYLSENTVGGPADVEGVATYYLGVLAFFLSVIPQVVMDREDKLSNSVAAFQERISLTMDGSPPVYVPRQERMPSYSIKEIRSTLS